MWMKFVDYLRLQVSPMMLSKGRSSLYLWREMQWHGIGYVMIRDLGIISDWSWEFHQKFYPMHLVHRDRNYIYNFWPRKGEIIAQAWGSLKSMLYSCPNHEISREIIILNFYARLSHNDWSMLDTSCAGSFIKKTIEFRWHLLEN